VTHTSERILNLSNYFNEPNFYAGFSLNGFSNQQTDDRKEFSVALGFDPEKLVIAKQVHGTHVFQCKKPGEINSTDGVISSDPLLILSIQVADCIPLYFLNKYTKEFGLIHAGWRGTAHGIVTEAIKVLSGEIQDNIFVIGPSIRQCCFEIGPEVAEIFPSKLCIKGKLDRSYLDLQRVVVDQLISLGAVSDKIVDMGECSHCKPELYHSYRRDGKKAGRMIAMAGWL